MISLYDIVEESSQIFEDFKSKYIRQANDCCKVMRTSLQYVVSRYTGIMIAWDKIEDKDVEIYSGKDIPDLLASFRKVKAGKEENYFIIGMLDENIRCIYIPQFTEMLLKEYNYFTLYRVNTTRQKDYKTAREQHDILLGCDYLLKISPKDFNVRDLMNSRRDSKYGMLPDLSKKDRESKHLVKGELGKEAGGQSSWSWHMGDYYSKCRQIAKDNINRYKEIIASGEMKKLEVDQKVVSRVESIMSRYNKMVSAIIAKKPEAESVTRDEWVHINKRVNSGGTGGLIPYLQRYYDSMYLVANAKEVNQRITDEISDARERAKWILEMCDELDNIFKRHNF
jgi:hypothetical protein